MKALETGVCQYNVDDHMKGERTGFEYHRLECGGKGGNAFRETNSRLGGKYSSCDPKICYRSRVERDQ